MDEQNEPAGPEESGEIYVSGMSLARGYLNRPDLTAEKYLPSSFEDGPGARACRTGDLGRMLPDGSLECLGRRDYQVKIRGYRVELSDVEAVLTRHNSVLEAVVIARTEEPHKNFHSQVSDKDSANSNAITSHLVAYVVVHPYQELTIQALRAYLKEHLPSYMIPSFFVFLDKLPLSNNGKVDRNLLSSSKGKDAYPEQQIEAPRNPVEEVLLGLWENTLDQEIVGIHSNFFELGGDSLAATRLISEIRKLFQCELGVRSLFGNPTVAKFAKALENVPMGTQKIRETAELILQVAEMSEAEVGNRISHEN